MLEESMLTKSVRGLSSSNLVGSLGRVSERSFKNDRIKYSGYLFKRSNQPYTEPAYQTQDWKDDYHVEQTELDSNDANIVHMAIDLPLKSNDDIGVNSYGYLGAKAIESDLDDATYVDEESEQSDNKSKHPSHYCFQVSDWILKLLGISRMNTQMLESIKDDIKTDINAEWTGLNPSPPMVQRLSVIDPSIEKQQRNQQESPRIQIQSQPIAIGGTSNKFRSLSLEEAILPSTSPILIPPKSMMERAPSENDDVPPSYIDERDGHIWRAKFCVLENGVLYFYKNAKIAKSVAAQNERDRNDKIYPSDEKNHQKNKGDSENGHLAKSPMPRSFMNLHPNQDNANNNQHPLVSAKENHACDSFCHDPNVYWEKRVALNMVGSVRTSPAFGESTFELLALNATGNTVDNDDGDRNVTDEVDKLILCASGGVDEVNTWIFEIHRSFVFLLKQMADFVGSHDSSSNQILKPSRAMTQSSRETSNDVAKSLGVVSYMQAARKGGAVLSTNTPSTFFIPSFASMSHGHGRRRRQEDGTLVEEDAIPSPYTPKPIRESSPTAYMQRQRSKSDDLMDDTSSYLLTPRYDFPVSRIPVTRSSNRLASRGTDDTIESPKHFEEDDQQKNSVEQQIHDVSSSSPISNQTGKYVPPHLRASATSKGKYIPPHLRNTTPLQSNLVSTVRHVSSDDTDNLNVQELFIPMLDQVDKNETQGSSEFLHSEGFGILIDDEDSETDTYETQIAATSNPSILMKLGGCADPSLIIGSICDSQYIPTKMSKVGKTVAPSYGFIGESFDIGAVSRCGVRDSNEDAYLILFDLLSTVAFDPTESLFYNFKSHSLFAIFDGHCGNHAARYAAEKFHDVLMDESRSLDLHDCVSTEELLHKLLSKSVDRLDKEFCHFCTQDGREWFSGSTAIIALMVDDHIAVAGVGDASGVICCTSSSPLGSLRSEGWIILETEEDKIDLKESVKSDGASEVCYTVYKEVADAHSPSHPDEKNRIEAANGWITYETEIPLISQFHRMNWGDKDVLDIFQRCFSDRFSEHQTNPSRILRISRVCGDLAVSRALGDREYKAAFNRDCNDLTLQENQWRCPAPMPFYEYNMQTGVDHSGLFTGDLVISTPGVKFFRVRTHGVDEFMLIACDGLWDVIDHDEAVRVTKNLLFQIKLSAEECAERLAELAGGLGSSDNVTVIVIKFK